jgi:hypothetical protein
MTWPSHIYVFDSDLQHAGYHDVTAGLHVLLSVLTFSSLTKLVATSWVNPKPNAALGNGKSSAYRLQVDNQFVTTCCQSWYDCPHRYHCLRTVCFVLSILTSGGCPTCATRSKSSHSDRPESEHCWKSPGRCCARCYTCICMPFPTGSSNAASMHTHSRPLTLCILLQANHIKHHASCIRNCTPHTMHHASCVAHLASLIISCINFHASCISVSCINPHTLCILIYASCFMHHASYHTSHKTYHAPPSLFVLTTHTYNKHHSQLHMQPTSPITHPEYISHMHTPCTMHCTSCTEQ